MDNLTYQNSTQHALITSFAWMLVGLVVTGITSLFFLSSGAFYMMLYRVPFLFIGIMIAQIAVVIAFTSAMRRSSANVMKILFMVYAVTLGITMTSIAFTYSLGTISLAFFVSAIYFLTLIVIGVTTKRDLSGMGTICLGALIALIVTQIILMILHIPMYSRVMCFLGLLIFTGLTVWDVSRMRQLLIYEDGYPVEQEKMAIYMALQLYLDFINIFLYIVRILGNRRK